MPYRPGATPRFPPSYWFRSGKSTKTQWGPLEQVIPVPGAVDGEAAPRMTVPVSIVEAARRVASATHAGSMNARRRHSALVLGRVETREDATVNLLPRQPERH